MGSYRKIWDPVRGSPLLFLTKDLVLGLRRELGKNYEVRIGFQYSEPSVETAINQLMALGVATIVLVPMFPHFAQATVGAFLVNTCRVAAEAGCAAKLQVVPPFYKNPGYLEVASEHIAAYVGP